MEKVEWSEYIQEANQKEASDEEETPKKKRRRHIQYNKRSCQEYENVKR
jgi:hypothetical protein